MGEKLFNELGVLAAGSVYVTVLVLVGVVRPFHCLDDGRIRYEFVMRRGRRAAMAGDPAAFMSYARFNDEHDDGQLSRFRERLAAEVRAQTGQGFVIFQDRADIAWGQNWQQRIDLGSAANRVAGPRSVVTAQVSGVRGALNRGNA